MPVASSNGTRDGIVWLVEIKTWNGGDKPAILHAYDAANVQRELYNTEQNSRRDRAGLTLRFTVPTVVEGRVYVCAKGRVDVYGLLGRTSGWENHHKCTYSAARTVAGSVAGMESRVRAVAGREY